MRTSRLTTSTAFLAVSLLLLCISASAAQAAEAETHILNEALSLTGACGPGNKLDTIPDPGCPGGSHPPAGPLTTPSSVSTDPHGDIYVASVGPYQQGGGFEPDKARIDVFDPSGHFLIELAVPGARVIAVDSGGHLYVGVSCSTAGLKNPGTCPEPERRLLRFDPTKYSPGTGEISYGDPPIELPLAKSGSSNKPVTDLAVDPTNQHLFVRYLDEVQELGPAVPGEPNAKLEEGIAASILAGDPIDRSSGVGLDAAHGLLYVSGNPGIKDGEGNEGVVRVLELEAPHALVRTIDGSTTPQGKFLSSLGQLLIATEEATGNFFVSDIAEGRVVYEFEEDGSYVASFKHGFESEFGYIHLDNSPESPNLGYLFVPAGHSPPDHVFAYQPKPEAHPPVVEAVSTSGVGRREATLRATINPEGDATHYTFEYTTQESFEAEGFAGALIAGEGDLAPGVAGIAVSAPLVSLSPGSAYRFRVRAESQCEPGGCSGAGEGSFTTFSAPLQGGSCENTPLRIGPSASLPDCRAYELVTPSDTNGHSPQGPVGGFGARFGTPPMSGVGGAVAFRIEGGPIPGTSGAGGFNGDAYLASRTASGWRTTSDSPTGEQSPVPSPGPLSPDLGYIAWDFGGKAEGNGAYVRYPDGSFHLVGEGTLANDPSPVLHYIAAGGAHVIFSSQKQLVPGAPEAPTNAIYDRTADEALHVVSLLPGDVIPNAGEDATFRGRSDNGSSVAFTVGGSSPLYVRVDNAETLAGSPAGGSFAGLSEDGRYLFYVTNGSFFRFDVQTLETIKIAGANPEPVNVPAQGSSAYFVSESKLDSKANPNGAKALTGQPNLYYWDGAENRFVATITPEDAKGEAGSWDGTSGYFGGFQEWMPNMSRTSLGFDPTRSSRQGSTLLFRSRAQLTPYDAEGHAEIYRFDATEGVLTCVSCPLTGSAAGSDADLATTHGNEALLNRFGLTANLSEDGGRAFFETSDRLVPEDNDGVQDVYEWEAEGKGSCRQSGGCLFLISSGQSARPNYLFGASASGDDVAFSTSDLLTAADQDETPSLYDARVEGGFPASAETAGECLGEACQPAAVPPPVVTPASSAFQGAGNVKEAKKHKKKRRRKHHTKKHHTRQSHRQGRSTR